MAPGEPDGVIQINVQIPAGLQPGTAEALVNIGGVSSQSKSDTNRRAVSRNMTTLYTWNMSSLVTP